MIRKLFNNNIIMLTIGLVLFLNFFIIGGMKLVRANESIQYEKSFITIEIQRGDTLISIAEEYAISEADYMAYIDEVKEINNLKDETIHAGCYLLVPIYSILE